MEPHALTPPPRAPRLSSSIDSRGGSSRRRGGTGCAINSSSSPTATTQPATANSTTTSTTTTATHTATPTATALVATTTTRPAHRCGSAARWQRWRLARHRCRWLGRRHGLGQRRGGRCYPRCRFHCGWHAWGVDVGLGVGGGVGLGVSRWCVGDVSQPRVGGATPRRHALRPPVAPRVPKPPPCRRRERGRRGTALTQRAACRGGAVAGLAHRTDALGWVAHRWHRAGRHAATPRHTTHQRKQPNSRETVVRVRNEAWHGCGGERKGGGAPARECTCVSVCVCARVCVCVCVCVCDVLRGHAPAMRTVHRAHLAAVAHKRLRGLWRVVRQREAPAAPQARRRARDAHPARCRRPPGDGAHVRRTQARGCGRLRRTGGGLGKGATPRHHAPHGSA